MGTGLNRAYDGQMAGPLLAALLLFAQAANPWDGTWKWATYPERIAWGEQFIAQSRQIADENCGKQYFGTYCRQPDGRYGYAKP